MVVEQAAGSIGPMAAVALVGTLGVGAQWLAWRLHLPGIVLMLAVGIFVGPATGILDPSVEFGALVQPLVALALAVILFRHSGATVPPLALNLYRVAVSSVLFLATLAVTVIVTRTARSALREETGA